MRQAETIWELTVEMPPTPEEAKQEKLRELEKELLSLRKERMKMFEEEDEELNRAAEEVRAWGAPSECYTSIRDHRERDYEKLCDQIDELEYEIREIEIRW